MILIPVENEERRAFEDATGTKLERIARMIHAPERAEIVTSSPEGTVYSSVSAIDVIGCGMSLYSKGVRGISPIGCTFIVLASKVELLHSGGIA